MSKKKITRIGRRTAATALWTDAEVLRLVDVLLIPRDAELAYRIRNVLGSRDGVGANRGSVLSRVKAFSQYEMEELGKHLGRACAQLEDDPANREKIKQLVAVVGQEMVRAGELADGDQVLRRLIDPHQVPA